MTRLRVVAIDNVLDSAHPNAGLHHSAPQVPIGGLGLAPRFGVKAEEPQVGRV